MKWKKEKRKKEHPVSFADQYIYGENYSDKYDYLRHNGKKNDVEKEQAAKTLKQISCVVGCILIFCLGYFLMCITMERNAMPNPVVPEEVPAGQEPGGLPDINDVDISLNAKYISSEYLDGGTMVDAVIRDAVDGGYNAVMFDLKRANGTLAYESTLTAAATYNAVASPGTRIQESVTRLLENNIIPLARIYCFIDSTAPVADSSIAVTNADEEVWRDRQGNAWLNPYAVYTAEYLTSIVLEVQDLGIQNIILAGLSFPQDALGDAVFNGGESNQPDQAMTDAFLTNLRRKTNRDTRLLAGTDLTIATQDELQSTIDAYASAYKSAGSVPVLTISVPAEDVMDALNEAKINSYILIIPANHAEKPTDTENQE